ncbi:MAG: YdcH family protein [Bdellovibrionales bacterium]|nr:YdcH family protein [Bdellovibrionales bacterium]
MDSREREELIRLAKENIELQRLFKRHEEYKEKIRSIRKRGLLTTFEQQEIQNLKLKKLRGKEQMYRMLGTLTNSSVGAAA